MESNLPIIAKKFWHMVRVAMYMLKKGVSKSKLLADLNMMMKRGKIVGKTLQNLMFNHSHHWAAASSAAFNRRSHDNNGHHLIYNDGPTVSYPANHPDEYEYTCGKSPAYPGFRLPFQLNKRKNKNHHHAAAVEEDDEFVMANAVVKALEMLQSATASPALPGFGKSPMVRQLRVTDSPFPLRDFDEGHSHVDEAAEKFIAKFYKDLRRQNAQN